MTRQPITIVQFISRNFPLVCERIIFQYSLLPTNQPYVEKELLSRIAGGDEYAFAQLFQEYKDKIYAIGLRLSGSEQAAEDLVQETFLKIWLQREALKNVTYFRAYLYTIARNHIIRFIKRRAKIISQTGSLDALQENSAADLPLLEKEYNTVYREAVNRLSPQQALVYRLSKQEGMKREAIASQLGLSPETVKTHLAQAMRNIRAYCLARLDLLLLIIFLKK